MKKGTKKHSPEITNKVLELRETQPNLTRDQIADLVGLTLGSVKRILRLNGKVLSMEQRQSNAYQAKLTKNPDAMVHMRQTLTLDVIAERSKSIRFTYKDNEELAEQARIRGERMWENWSPEYKAEYLERRKEAWEKSEQVQERLEELKTLTGAQNPKSVALLKKEGVKNFDELMHKYAKQHNGKYLGGYTLSHEKCKWQCDKGHPPFQMDPNSVQQGRWCRKCACSGSRSERALYTYLSQYIEGLENGAIGLLPSKKLEIDIWYPLKKRGIEFDGAYWHDRPERQACDIRKNLECIQMGIELLRINFEDWQKNSDRVQQIALEFLIKA